MILCDDRQAPWLPLCEHADTVEVAQLTASHTGRRIQVGDDYGVLEAVRRIDEHTVQLVLVRDRTPTGTTVVTAPIGAEARMTGRGTLPGGRAP